MKTASLTRITIAAAAVCGALALPSLSVAAVDAAAAEQLARQQNCLKCHGIDKDKDGPSYKSVAARFKGKAGAEDRLYKHITSGEKAKFADGHEEEHKIIKAKEPEARNLIQWILSL